MGDNGTTEALVVQVQRVRADGRPGKQAPLACTAIVERSWYQTAVSAAVARTLRLRVLLGTVAGPRMALASVTLPHRQLELVMVCIDDARTGAAGVDVLVGGDCYWRERLAYILVRPMSRYAPWIPSRAR